MYPRLKWPGEQSPHQVKSQTTTGYLGSFIYCPVTYDSISLVYEIFFSSFQVRIFCLGKLKEDKKVEITMKNVSLSEAEFIVISSETG